VNRNLRRLGLGVGIRMLGNAIYAPFLALFLTNVLGVGYLEIGILFVAVGLVQLPFNFVGGLATDRVGRQRLILIGLAVEAVTTAALAFAFLEKSLLAAVVTATLGGIVGTTTGPASSAYIADFAEGAERTRGFTFYRIGFNAGYSAGVAVGGLLISVVGFAGAVAVAAAIIGVCTGFLILTLDPSPKDIVLRQSGRRGLGEGATPRPPSRPIGESLRILARHRVALELLIAVAFAGVVVGQWAVIFPLYVHNILGIDYSFLGAGLALNGLVVVFGQQATTERVIGRRHTTIAIAGVGLYVVGFLGLAAAGWAGFFPVAVFFGAVIVLTIGENLVTIPQATLPSNLAPPEEVGAYNGAFAMVAGAGFLISIFVGGVVLSWTADPLLIWIILVAPAFPSMLLFRHAAGRLAPEVDRA
jgi:MFS family permease